MKTQSYIESLCASDRAAWISEYNAFKAAIKTLESIYGETVLGKPSDTVDRFIAAVGIDMAKAVVGTLVNRSAWDGRISKRAADWAAAIPDIFDEDTATCHYFSTNRIHMAHLDQIACVMMKR